MKTLLIVSFLAWFTGLALGAVNVVCSWDANEESHCAGYRVLIGSAPRTYTMTNSMAGRLTTNTVMSPTSLPKGVVYMAVVAYDAEGVDSLWSNEVVYTNRLTAPLNFKVRTTITFEGSP